MCNFYVLVFILWSFVYKTSELLTLFSIALTSSSQIKHKNAYENMQALIYLPYKKQQQKLSHFTLKPAVSKRKKN